MKDNCWTWTLLFLTLLLGICDVVHSSSAYSGWPECSDLRFNEHGIVNVGYVLYNCSAQIPGVKLPPSYFNSSENNFEPTVITTSMKINNLVEINDVNTKMDLDFYFRMSWNDTRWNVPRLFDYLNPDCLSEGIDLTAYINDPDNPLPIFLPDIVFYQSLEVNLIAEMLKFYKDGSFYWSRHLYVSMSEPVMSFKKYPLDVQNFSFVFQSYGYDTNFIQLSPKNPGAVTFNFDNQQNTFYVKENQLWKYQSYSAYVEDDPSPSVKNPDRKFSNVYTNLKFAREPLGVIYRLALPVTILLIIVGFSFWADIEERAGVTLNMLLVVAALYIVIGEVIPFVGYLSLMDVFTTSTFVLLSITVGVNVLVMKLISKEANRPLHLFHVDLIHFVMRIVWIPMVILMFIIIFDVHVLSIDVVLYSMAVICFFNGLRKIPYMRRSFKTAILLLRAKELKIKEINFAVKALDRNANASDSDDEYEDDDPHEDAHKSMKKAFMLQKETVQAIEEMEEKALKQKGRELRLSKFERRVLQWTRHLFNDNQSRAEVFGTDGLNNPIHSHQEPRPSLDEVEMKSTFINNESTAARQRAVVSNL